MVRMTSAHGFGCLLWNATDQMAVDHRAQLVRPAELPGVGLQLRLSISVIRSPWRVKWLVTRAGLPGKSPL
jgi:hypothetical protein